MNTQSIGIVSNYEPGGPGLAELVEEMAVQLALFVADRPHMAARPFELRLTAVVPTEDTA